MLLLTTTLLWLHLCSAMKEQKFYTGVLCDLEKRLSNNCSTLLTGIHSWGICLMECNKNSLCIGVSLSGQTKQCFQHSTCDSVSGCTKKEEDHRYRSKNCAHGGTWNPVKSVCSCTNSWIGKSCLELPSGCSDLLEAGYTSRHRTYLTLGRPNSLNPIPAVCLINVGNSWTAVEVLRNSENVGLNRTWEEYKHGFFVDRSNNWLGLNHWQALSEAGYSELTVSVSFGDQYIQYLGFALQSESRNFSFTFGSLWKDRRDANKFVRIDFPDCFGPLQNTPFSALDMDNDGEHNRNCASNVGIGWWFAGSCNMDCNLLGISPSDWNNVEVTPRMALKGVAHELFEKEENPEFLIYFKKKHG